MSHRFIPGIASQSLGNPQHHGIHDKLQAAAAAGLGSIEIFFEDIAQLAQHFHHDPNVLALQFQPTSTHIRPGSSYQDEVILRCAQQIRQWCSDTTPRSLEVICLQPFMHYEGLLDAHAHEERIKKLEISTGIWLSRDDQYWVTNGLNKISGFELSVLAKAKSPLLVRLPAPCFSVFSWVGEVTCYSSHFCLASVCPATQLHQAKRLLWRTAWTTLNWEAVSYLTQQCHVAHWLRATTAYPPWSSTVRTIQVSAVRGPES